MKGSLTSLPRGPGGDLAAFCICGLRGGAGQVGYTDPIGVRPNYQNLGLGKAIVTAGLKNLQARGAKVVELGTSSDNFRMQRLAESLGFAVASERLWYTKKVDGRPLGE
jgi:ribosomal protein S18 acetylase RimI-like enzyme